MNKATGLFMFDVRPQVPSEGISESALLDPGLGGKTPVPADLEGPAPNVQFVCTRCWSTFTSWSRESCSRCASSRPAAGWASLPYTYRNRYVFLRSLGRGGMGAVFLAHDEQQLDEDKRRVAVKVVPQDGSKEVQQTIKYMFEREAAAAAMLGQSAHFVRVVGHDVAVEPAYIAMEYVDWPTLRMILRRASGKVRALSPVRAARIGIAILRGLSTMHFHRIVHRDLKPDNIFVRRASGDEYDIKILDLGVWALDALAAQGGASIPAAMGARETSPVGTFSYMSPEQMELQPASASSDLHTVGSVLWELVTGHVPYPMPKKELAPAMRERMESMKAPPVRPPAMPDGFYEVLSRALAFDPRERWESADEMKSALKVWMAEEVLRSRALVSDGARRLEMLIGRTEALRNSLDPSAKLLLDLTQLSERLTAFRGHIDEAAPDRLKGAIDEAEAWFHKLGRDAGAQARAMLSRLEESGIAATTDILIEPPPQPSTKPSHSASKRSPTNLRPMLLGALGAAVVAAAVTVVGARLRGPDDSARQRVPPPSQPAGQSVTHVSTKQRDVSEATVNRASNDAHASTPSSLLGDGHSGGYVSVAFSPVAPIVATGSADGSVRLWDTEAKRVTAVMNAHGGVVFDVAFAPDGRLVAGAYEDGTVRLFDTSLHHVVLELPAHKGIVRSVRFAKDAKVLASAGEDGTIRMFDVATGRDFRALSVGDGTPKKGKSKTPRTPPPEVRSLALSPDGEKVLAAYVDGHIVAWDTQRATPAFRVLAHDGGAFTVAFSPDQKRFASAGADQKVRLFDARGQALATVDGHKNQIRSVAFSPDGRFLVSGSLDRTVRIVDAATGEVIRVLSSGHGPVSHVAYSPDGRFVVAGSHDKSVSVYDVESGSVVAHLAGREGAVLGIAMHPSGSQFVSSGLDGVVRAIDARSGALLNATEERHGPVQAVAYAPDGQLVAAGGSDGAVRVLFADSLAPARTFEAQKTWIYAVTFSPRGSLLAAGGDGGTIHLWDRATGASKGEIRAHAGTVRGLAFTPNESVLVSVGDDRFVHVFDTKTRSALRKIGPLSAPLRAVSISPDGTQIAAGGDDGLVRLWDAKSGRLIRTYGGAKGAIHAVAFSFDGRAIAAGSLDAKIRVYASGGSRLLHLLEGHELGIASLAFSPDGTSLASAGHDSTRRVWDLATGQFRGMSLAREDAWVVFDGSAHHECTGAGCVSLGRDP